MKGMGYKRFKSFPYPASGCPAEHPEELKSSNLLKIWMKVIFNVYFR
jgi:hypothetical protein